MHIFSPAGVVGYSALCTIRITMSGRHYFRVEAHTHTHGCSSIAYRKMCRGKFKWDGISDDGRTEMSCMCVCVSVWGVRVAVLEQKEKKVVKLSRGAFSFTWKTSTIKVTGFVGCGEMRDSRWWCGEMQSPLNSHILHTQHTRLTAHSSTQKVNFILISWIYSLVSFVEKDFVSIFLSRSFRTFHAAIHTFLLLFFMVFFLFSLFIVCAPNIQSERDWTVATTKKCWEKCKNRTSAATHLYFLLCCLFA